MEKQNNIFWQIPFFFFLFLGIFLTIKFLFIFFFRAAFEPHFLFELTPFYLLTGMNNLQLLLLSFLVVAYDTYLHVKLTRRNLIRSFIPTSIMLAGLGIGIATNEISLENIPQYLLFGILLFIILIDHRRTLIFTETLPLQAPIAQQPISTGFKLPFLSRRRSREPGVPGKPRISLSTLTSVFSLFKKVKIPKRKKLVTTTSDQPPAQETQRKEETPTKSPEDTPVGRREKPGEPVKTGPPQPIAQKTPTSAPSAGGGGGTLDARALGEKQSPPEVTGMTAESLKPSSLPDAYDEKRKALKDIKTPTTQEETSAGDLLEFIDTDKQKSVTETAVKKPVISKEDIKILKKELGTHQNEITTESSILQELQSNFKNIVNGLDSLQNELKHLGQDLQIAEEKPEILKKEKGGQIEQFIQKKPPLESRAETLFAERKPRLKPDSYRVRSLDKRAQYLLRAQVRLEELEKKVVKLEHIYIN